MRLGQFALKIILLMLLLSSCAPVARSSPAVTQPTGTQSLITQPPTTVIQLPLEFSYSVVATYPHDTSAFTEGLVYDDGVLYEGTGMVGQSSLRKVDLKTGEVLQMVELPSPFFGEGVTTFGNRIYQLTWKSKTGFVYDKATFEMEQKFTYSTQGWGLTHDATSLIMSDGTRTLYYLDPDTFDVTATVEVKGGPEMIGTMQLNELEYIRGQIYANLWPTDFIVIIDAATGIVTGWVNIGGILGGQNTRSVDVLNGIAYDEADDRLFVTGKYWPSLFEIRLLQED